MEKTKFKDFPQVSKEEWLVKIGKEYRGNKSLESFCRKNGELTWNPYLHPTDNQLEFKIKAFPNTFFTGIVYSNEMTDEQLINSLEAGVSIIYIDSECEWKAELCDKIRWDFIQSIIVNNQYFVEQLKETCDERKLTIDKNVVFTTVEKILVIKIDDYLLGNKQVESLKSNINSMEFIDLVLFELGDAFLFNIGFMRGVVKFFQEKSDNSRILAVCSGDDSSDVAVLIAETAQVISARLAGVPNVLLSNGNADSLAYYKSMISNILDYESELKFEDDPISGSQYLDQISSQVYKLLK